MSLPLSIPLWLPAAAAFLGLFLPGVASRALAILGALGTFAWTLWAIADFERGAKGLQDATDQMWIKPLGIHYKLGLDGLNLYLIALAAFIFLVCLIWAAMKEWEHGGQLFFFFGLAESAVLGALMAQDLALFVLFFDLMLLPFLFLAGIYGPEGTRVAAITKLFIYTLVGSLLMLAAAIATGVLVSQQTGNDLSFAFSDLQASPLGKGSQEWIFLCFAAAFWVKMPAFPVHGWMPDGYKNMPLPVLAVFSAVLSKVAAYGFLRVVLPIFPDAAVHFQDLMLVLALGSILYGSAMAFTTTDARLILGYSSIAQLGFITLGIFSLTGDGSQGAILQSINHGLVVAPAFVIVAYLAERAHGSEDIRDMGGIAFRAPVLATLFLIVVLANLAMPGSSNFVGEFLILFGVFHSKLVIASIAFVGVGMAAVYSLRFLIRTMHNRVGPEVESREISFREGLVLVPLVTVILFLAVYPQFAIHKAEPGIARAVAPAALIAHEENVVSDAAVHPKPASVR
ncbi:NADH-quinone oxidoreductase subunit M [Baekduia alba]|uniref:complex I subunit 4 family protein n=1 Tax=Baekduia alba TaxID=2997333 RepID=UPI0023424929|nr:NADH-quinone oxidoreductase subunit M [Baekduia alba]WCB92068.1 NADH-quinone oxidoreductase subunit M [Baekduia alba]